MNVWRYTIRARGPLNARASSSDREGALIRDDGGGVGCIHPWPELGDEPLNEQLTALAAGRPTNLGEQALLCAEADGFARRQGRSLFSGLNIPPSHWTAPGHVFSPPPEGFDTIKLKSVAHLGRYRAEFPHHRLRIDFNDTLTESGFRDWWLALDDATRAVIEFIEDPIPWDPAAWRRLREELGAPLAADREVMTRAGEADWLIVKPATINAVEPGELAWRTGKRVAFTSYLDHAIGQLHAAWRAAECAAIFGDRLGACGLVTHHLFEPDPFFERLSFQGNRLTPPGGTGLGFDDLLDSLPWKPLT
jgi:O-succinylbenzoate synthase